MGALFTVEKNLRVKDYYNGVVKAYANKCPLQALLKRGAKPTDWAQEVEVEGNVVPGQLAVAEGGDVTSGFDSYGTMVLAHELQKWRTAGWQVTPESELMPSHNELRGEKSVARQMRKDAEKLVVSIENAISSEQEAVLRGTSSSTVPKTRGLMSWLATLDGSKNTAALLHPVQTIPDKLIPSAGIVGDTTSAEVFSENIFKAELIKAALECGDSDLTLVGLCGLKLKSLMSEWMGKATNVNGITNLVNANRDVDRKSIGFIVDEFVYDGVRVKTMVDNHLLADTSTNICGTASQLSGAFIRPELWSIDCLQPVVNKDCVDNGGGKRGFHWTVLRLACHNPLGQMRVKYSA